MRARERERRTRSGVDNELHGPCPIGPWIRAVAGDGTNAMIAAIAEELIPRWKSFLHVRAMTGGASPGALTDSSQRIG